MFARIFAGILFLSSLAACGSFQAAMPYAPTRAVEARAPNPVVWVSQVSSEHRAGGRDPAWVGTIRGGFGNALKELHVSESVDKVVTQAFADGLAARGLCANSDATARYDLAVTINRLDSSQYVRREANADFSITLRERASGREVWRDRHRSYEVDGSPFALDVGIFGSPDDLRRVVLHTMDSAVDVLLDNPKFRASLQDQVAQQLE